jgi:hypothetical protein
VTDQVSHAYKTTAIVFSVANRKSKYSEPSGRKYSLKLTGSLLLQAWNLLLSIPNIELPTFSNN